MKKLNIGIIGAGRIGKLHAENLIKHIKGAKLVAIAETRKGFSLAACRITADYHDLLTPEFDAVLICSPTDTHAQMIIDAAEAGKHIFCEKPIDFDLGKIDQALKAVKEARVKLQIGFNRRFDPDFMQIKQDIMKGKIGFLRKIKIISRDPSPPSIDYIKKSGGIFMDMTIHDFDMVRFLTNAEPEWIFVYGNLTVDTKIGDAGDIDTAEILIGFQNGIIATIDNCRHSAIGYDQRVEAFGSKDTVFNKNRGKNTNFFTERYAESYILEMQAFVNAILKNKPVPVTGLDGRIPIIMALAAQKSLKEKRVVRLSEVTK